ncbi:putative kynurenine formamidase [Wickerhamomyces ciferrii]|uniref:GPI inositol-deacylase n=1 Tax=Wickerhamomyces ciferrii (strain ATCC 14091 / BCRC 22168 / CBS 111 / JCM 3599 / NBRC 0793 / NRRL Y-1031 F-60-10) TaxID=1206466 RepID=K0KTB1_WICCF|nr:putative kynurenine formamidase [Wickerhamomyces ciferrii]CCH44609.1 putative kynurenine formamidase [Wickerhamomyces ciferrii]
MPIKRHQWGSHTRQYIEELKINPQSKDAVITIHGGGWVSHQEAAKDYFEMSNTVDFDANFFGVDYRLSASSFEGYVLPDPIDSYVKAPYHLLDILHGIEFIFDNYEIERVHLIGHSVGGCTALQIQDFASLIPHGLQQLVKHGVITESEEKKQLKFVEETLKKWSKVELLNVIYLSGVYDFPLALSKVASLGPPKGILDNYIYINDAFVSEEHYTQGCTITSTILNPPLDTLKAKGKHVIIHSFEDEFVESFQPLGLANFFYKLNVPVEVYIDDFDLHHKILLNGKAFKIIERILNDH